MAELIPENLPQIGPATLAVLRAKGITTNIDVLYVWFPATPRSHGHNKSDDGNPLNQIPGIGYGREAVLREWAHRVPFTKDENSEFQKWTQHWTKQNSEQSEELKRQISDALNAANEAVDFDHIKSLKLIFATIAAMVLIAILVVMTTA